MSATTPAPQTSRRHFVKAHILPALLVLIIPAFSWWFFSYAEKQLDGYILQSVEKGIAADKSLKPAEKTRILEFYRRVPVSHIMASNKPEAAEMQADFADVSVRYAIFRWCKRTAWICLAAVAVTFIIVGISVVCSLRSQPAQYYSLRIGWPVLRTSAAIQVIGQSTLAVFLSFWIPAIFTEKYYIKLIAIIGILAIGAVVALVKAIFTKPGDRFTVEGETIPESDAPRLWQRIREMAARLGTAAPDHVIVGVEPSFFVTEHPVSLESGAIQGRSLYLSLPMLKVLSTDEADSILGHELAHFSGQDTLWSRKIAPLRSKFVIYLIRLDEGLSAIVAQFMLAFWKLYSLSIQKLSRDREFRADTIGAELVSREAFRRALVKVTCYCEFRAEKEQSILEKRKVDSELNLAHQLEQGYPAFLGAVVQSERAVKEEIPHPFDSHPTLEKRLEHLGFDPRAALHDPEVQQPSASTWFDAIATAPQLEEKWWNRQQEALQEHHSLALAWTLQPQNDEELAAVREHFPDLVFRSKKGESAVLTWNSLVLPSSPEPIPFSSIVVAETDTSWGRQRLNLTLRPVEGRKSQKISCYPKDFLHENGDLLAGFGHYFSRHKTAENHNEKNGRAEAAK